MNSSARLFADEGEDEGIGSSSSDDCDVGMTSFISLQDPDEHEVDL